MLQKKLMIALCLFLISANVFSQNEETATVKGISDAVCDCMKSKNADYTSKEAVNNEFVACFSSSEILSMLLNYAKDKGIDVEDVEKMRGIGKLVITPKQFAQYSYSRCLVGGRKYNDRV